MYKYLIIFLLPLIIVSITFTRLSFSSDLKLTQYKIEHLSDVDGLPQNSVQTIIQSSKGYLLFGTQNGLAIFDGVSFSVHNKNSSPLISNDFISCIYEDSNKTLWIGTEGGGIARFDNSRFEITNCFNELYNTRVKAIIEDKNKNIWIGSSIGLYKISNFFTNEITKIDGLGNKKINFLLEDQYSNIWVATLEGLYKITSTGIYTYTTKNGLLSDIITSICEDKKNNIIYVASRMGGINIYDSINDNFITYKQPYIDINSLYIDKTNILWIGTSNGLTNSKNINKTILDYSILSIFEDSEGSLWVGTSGDGIYQLRKEKFVTYSTKEGLTHDMVRAICEDKQGNIWIATNKGLNKLDNDEIVDNPILKQLSNVTFRSLYCDNKNNLWMGTTNGLYLYDGISLNKYTTKDGLCMDNIYSIYQDSTNVIWIGTTKGLNKFEYGKEYSFIKVNQLSNDFIITIYEDNKRNIWFGTKKGLIRYFDNLFSTYTTKDGLSSDIIFSIHQDNSNDLWIGTQDNGLNKYSNNEFLKYTSKNGLPNDTIYSIIEDSNKQLWVSSNKGIFRLDLNDIKVFDTGKIKDIPNIHYKISDGLPTLECNGGTQPNAILDSKGNFWFSTVKGAVKIDQNNILINNNIPPIYIENIIINNQVYDPSKGVIIDYNQNDLIIHFAILSYIYSSKLYFKYKLEGYDTDWKSSNAGREINYSRLSPGEYTFKISACNNDGIWNNTNVSCSITITPLFYQTKVFYIFCFLFMLFSFYLMYKLKIHSLNKNRKKLESIVKQRTQELTDANQAKNQFLANMTHDLRTPLGIIKVYCSLIKAELHSEKLHNYINVIFNSLTMLTEMVSNLFELSKIEAGKIVVNYTNIDFVELVDMMTDELSPLCEKKGLVFNIITDNNLPSTFYSDLTKLKQIIMNLVTNAIKFTESGSITINIKGSPDYQFIIFSIKDTGIGIPQDSYENIFKPFFRTKIVEENRIEGVGLGLTIVKQFVELLKGEIQVTSLQDQGSTFTFSILNLKNNPQEKKDSLFKKDNLKPYNLHILFVEDDDALIKGVTEFFNQRGFNFSIATNGEQAIKMAKSDKPDIILMDIKLSKIDGETATKKIREFDNHTPIIAVTAYAIKGDKERLIDLGCTDYLSKPYGLADLENIIKKNINVL